MKKIKPQAILVNVTLDSLGLIETAGHVCYNAAKKTPTEVFIKKLLCLKHESVLEHASATVHFVCSRGISHELVRHRIASYSQASTRYINYAKTLDLEFIYPHWWFNTDMPEDYLLKRRDLWTEAMRAAEFSYIEMVKGEYFMPQDARDVLPQAFKTELYMTANLREWRHIFELRMAEKAHPDMRLLMALLYKQMTKEKFGCVFEEYKYLYDNIVANVIFPYNDEIDDE